MGRNNSINTNTKTIKVVVQKQTAITVQLSAKATLTCTPPAAGQYAWAWSLKVYRSVLKSGSSNDSGGAQAAGTTAWYGLGSP